MTRKLLVAVGAVLSLHCIQDPRSISAGGHLTLTTSAPSGSNVQGGTFDAKTIAGNYNGADRKPGTDGGYSVITGTPNALDNDTCKGIGIGFTGKPEAGKTWNLAFIHADSSGDAGTTDGGVPTTGFADGRGTLTYSEGCLNKGAYNLWRSTAGTLTVTAVEEPSELPQGATPGANKTVKFTFSGVQMAADQTTATGTFTASGDGEITLFAGMNQP